MDSTLRRTWAEIDLDALAHNYRTLHSRMGGRARFLGVVKADAYGHGAVEVSRTLEELGAELVPFSPLEDPALPEDIHGLYLCGGYPELYAEKLSQNGAMRRNIRESIAGGMPYLAECGGFLYLQESMEDMEGAVWEMAGVCSGTAYRTNQLGRFGYITLEANNDRQILKPQSSIKGHEYHYYDCTENGSDYHGMKPLGNRVWDCIKGGKSYAAGFPHLYYYSNPEFISEFLEQCRCFHIIHSEKLSCQKRKNEK